MFGEIADILFLIILALILVYLLYRFNKWLLVKYGIMRILYVVLKKPEKGDKNS